MARTAIGLTAVLAVAVTLAACSQPQPPPRPDPGPTPTMPDPGPTPTMPTPTTPTPTVPGPSASLSSLIPTDAVCSGAAALYNGYVNTVLYDSSACSVDSGSPAFGTLSAYQFGSSADADAYLAWLFSHSGISTGGGDCPTTSTTTTCDDPWLSGRFPPSGDQRVYELAGDQSGSEATLYWTVPSAHALFVLNWQDDNSDAPASVLAWFGTRVGTAYANASG